MRHHNLFEKATDRFLASRYPLVLLAVVGMAACSETAIGTLPTQPAPLTPAPVPGFPALSRPGTIYERVTASVFPSPQRYVVFGDGTFSHQFINDLHGLLEYKGRYVGQGSELQLLFDDNHGSWFASAIVGGDSLFVKYNMNMVLSDFEDGVFRSPR